MVNIRKQENELSLSISTYFAASRLPVSPGKVSLADALVLHKGGIASIDQGENPDFKLK